METKEALYGIQQTGAAVYSLVRRGLAAARDYVEERVASDFAGFGDYGGVYARYAGRKVVPRVVELEDLDRPGEKAAGLPD